MPRFPSRRGYPRVAAIILAGVVAIAVVATVAGAQETVGQSPVVGGYSQSLPGQIDSPPPPIQEVATETRREPAAPREPAAQRAIKPVERGTLPFTGGQLALLALGALGLVGLGMALRRATALA